MKIRLSTAILLIVVLMSVSAIGGLQTYCFRYAANGDSLKLDTDGHFEADINSDRARGPRHVTGQVPIERKGNLLVVNQKGFHGQVDTSRNTGQMTLSVDCDDSQVTEVFILVNCK